MKTLFDSVKSNSKLIRFHTPGHSGTLDKNLIKCDVTELPYTDNLLNSKGYIYYLENKLASIYKAEACFISTNGATNSIFQAVIATRHLGNFLIVGENHVSVYNAIRISGRKAYHIDELKEDSILSSDIKIAIVCSPDYFGFVKDLKKIRSICDKNNLVLIIDASHGAHFAFSFDLPENPVLYGDLTVFSLHKTLPVATGGSVLCVKKNYEKQCFISRIITHSTSPSFITLCSIDKAVKEFEKSGENYYQHIKDAVERFSISLDNKFYIKKNADFSRLLLESPFDGEDAFNCLLNTYGIAAETYYKNLLIFIVTPYNVKHLQKLAKALNNMDKLQKYVDFEYRKTKHQDMQELTFFKEMELISIKECQGRKAFCEIGTYPPGIPMLYSGQIIEKSDMEYLNKYSDICFGLVKSLVPVVK